MGTDIKKRQTFTVRKLFVECLPHLTFLALYLTIATGSSVLSDMFPLLFLGFGILSFYYVGWKASLRKRSAKSLRYSYGQGDLAMECSCVMGLVIMFGLFFQYLDSNFPGLFSVEDGTNYWQWLLFTLENIFESIFDVFSLYEISLSGIEPDHFAAKTIILGFRFSVNLVTLLLLIRNWRNLKAYWRIHQTATLRG